MAGVYMVRVTIQHKNSVFFPPKVVEYNFESYTLQTLADVIVNSDSKLSNKIVGITIICEVSGKQGQFWGKFTPEQVVSFLYELNPKQRFDVPPFTGSYRIMAEWVSDTKISVIGDFRKESHHEIVSRIVNVWLRNKGEGGIILKGHKHSALIPHNELEGLDWVDWRDLCDLVNLHLKVFLCDCPIDFIDPISPLIFLNIEFTDGRGWKRYGGVFATTPYAMSFNIFRYISKEGAVGSFTLKSPYGGKEKTFSTFASFSEVEKYIRWLLNIKDPHNRDKIKTAWAANKVVQYYSWGEWKDWDNNEKLDLSVGSDWRIK